MAEGLTRDLRSGRLVAWRVRRVGWRHVLLLGMVRRYRVIGALSSHDVRAVASVCRLRHRLRVAVVVVLRAAVVRACSTVWSGRRGNWWHAICWDKRLGFGVERRPAVAARNWVLALWIIWVDIHWQLSICIGNARRRHRAGSGLIRTLIVGLRLLPSLRRYGWHRCSVGSNHWRIRGLIARLLLRLLLRLRLWLRLRRGRLRWILL